MTCTTMQSTVFTTRTVSVWPAAVPADPSANIFDKSALAGTAYACAPANKDCSRGSQGTEV